MGIKGFVVALVVVFMTLVSAQPADAQSLWSYLGGCSRGDELCRVMVGNQQMIRHMQSGYMGHMGNGGFYGTHDPYGRPLPRLVKIAVGAGIGASIGGGVGDLFGRGRAGTLIGAGIGALIGARRGSGKKDQPMVIDEGQQVRIGQDGVPVAVGRPVVPRGGYQPVSSPSHEEGGWTIKNRSGFRVELWRGEQFEALLLPGQTTRVVNPDGMTAIMLIPGPGGKIDKVGAQVLPNSDFGGWDLMVPAGR